MSFDGHDNRIPRGAYTRPRTDLPIICPAGTDGLYGYCGGRLGQVHHGGQRFRSPLERNMGHSTNRIGWIYTSVSLNPFHGVYRIPQLVNPSSLSRMFDYYSGGFRARDGGGQFIRPYLYHHNFWRHALWGCEEGYYNVLYYDGRVGDFYLSDMEDPYTIYSSYVKERGFFNPDLLR